VRWPIIVERADERRTFRLWHLVVAVFVAALIFAGLRGLVHQPNGAAIGALSALVLSSVSVAISFGFIHIGKKLGGGGTGDLMGWGVHRGGLVGFCAWLLGMGMKVGLLLLAIVVGPVATVALIWVLINRLGGF
jgi:hypothetical protein